MTAPAPPSRRSASPLGAAVAARLPLAVALAALPLYALLALLAGQIPFYGGAGFDGAVYLDYLQRIAAGQPLPADPYRLMRLPGFAPAWLAAELGLPAGAMLAWQRAANVLLLAAGLGLMADVLRRVGQPARRALPVLCGLWLAWPYALMPVYNPMLSDHAALFIAMLALWAWARALNGLLALLLLAACWVLPGLFVLPAVLLALPFAPARADAGAHGPSRADAGAPGPSRALSWAAAAAVLAVLGAVWLAAAGVPAADIAAHPPGTTLGKSGLRPITLAWLAGALLGAAAVLARLLGAPAFWRSLRGRGAVAALLLALLGAATVWLALDWNGGHQGPPLQRFVLLQGLAAPAKPLVAHFVYFGPVSVLALAALAARPDALLARGLAAPLALGAAFLPLLLFASESRQWVYLLPVMALLAAASARGALLWLQAVVALALLAPALWLRQVPQMPAPRGMLSDGWQLYFGRLGPWMGDATYAAGAALLLLFGLAVWWGRRAPGWSGRGA